MVSRRSLALLVTVTLLTGITGAGSGPASAAESEYPSSAWLARTLRTLASQASVPSVGVSWDYRPANYDGDGGVFYGNPKDTIVSGYVMLLPAGDPLTGVDGPNTYKRQCTSIADPRCEPRYPRTLISLSVLDACLTDNELGCIERIEASSGDSPPSALTRLGVLKAENAPINEDTARGVPAGSTPSVWSDGGGNAYLVTPRLQISHMATEPAKGGTPVWRRFQTDFDLEITKVTLSPRSGNESPGFLRRWPELTGDFTDGARCMSDSACVREVAHSDRTRFRVSLRLPDHVGGFLTSRMESGTVTTEALRGGRIRYVIDGRTAAVRIAGGAVPVSDYSSAMGGKPDAGWAWAFSPVNAVEMFTKLEKWTGETALAVRHMWRIESTIIPASGPRAECLSSVKGLSGLVATNAAVYGSTAPDWDPATSSFSYRVASPHRDADGTKASGTYSLLMHRDAVRCLYGSINLPSRVTVSVQEDGVGVTSTAVVTIRNDDSWVNFAVSGFHFSAPTLNVKLGRAFVLRPGTTTSISTVARRIGLRPAAVRLAGTGTSKMICGVSARGLVTFKSGTCMVRATVGGKTRIVAIPVSRRG